MARLRSLQPRLKSLDTRSAKPAEKQADPVYHTPEYRLWRNAVIGRAGGRCEWPGCDQPPGRRYADHIVELKDGGAPFDTANGQCLCAAHHVLKGNRARAERQRS